jgi:hypothetical protein
VRLTKEIRHEDGFRYFGFGHPVFQPYDGFDATRQFRINRDRLDSARASTDELQRYCDCISVYKLMRMCMMIDTKVQL